MAKDTKEKARKMAGQQIRAKVARAGVARVGAARAGFAPSAAKLDELIEQRASELIEQELQEAVQEPEPLYRASLQTERQKFGRTDAELQQLLPYAQEPNELAEAELSLHTDFGLDFTVEQDKAFSAIQKLLDQTDYQGEPSLAVTSRSDAWQGTVRQAGLVFTWPEYFSAYGLDTGQHQRGRQATRAKEALRSLAEPHLICFEWQYQTKKGKRSDIIRTRRPLVEFIEAFEGLTEEEAAKVRAGEDVEHRATRVAIRVSPLLVEGLEEDQPGFYILKPHHLHNEIQELYGSKRYPACVPRLISLLLTYNLGTVELYRETLASRLRLDSLLQQRKTGRVEDLLAEALNVAKELGYLTGWQIQDSAATWKLHKYQLQLNPDRCSRVRKALPEAATK